MRLRCYNFRYAMRLMTLSQRLPVSQNPPICWGDAGGFASLRHALTRPAIGYCHCDARLLNKARQPEAGYHYRAHHADRVGLPRNLRFLEILGYVKTTLGRRAKFWAY
jgi:hypothetical protein